MKTIEDYQKRHNHIKNYCEKMIYKFTITLEEHPNNYDAQIKRKTYQDILFKLNYTKNETEKTNNSIK